MKRRALISSAVLFFLFSSAVFSSQVEKQDAEFLSEAVKSGQFLEALGKTASTLAAGGEVRQFGREVMNDFSKANKSVRELSAERGIAAAAMDESRRSTLEWFQRLKGAEFDREFMSLMIDELYRNIEAYGKEIRSGSDLQVKGFAEGRAPALENHLKSARTVFRGIPAPLLK
jgi:putative membrane protein